MQMPGPGDAHRGLQVMAGTWSGEETIHPAPWDPAGGHAAARVCNRLALDGQVLIQDYEQVRVGGAPTFAGHGVLRWDADAREYVFHWFDSIRTSPGEFRGTFDGGTLTLVRRGAPGWARARYDFAGDRYTYRMDVSGDGEQWQPFTEGEYRREEQAR
jgi:hypothetical protein